MMRRADIQALALSRCGEGGASSASAAYGPSEAGREVLLAMRATAEAALQAHGLGALLLPAGGSTSRASGLVRRWQPGSAEDVPFVTALTRVSSGEGEPDTAVISLPEGALRVLSLRLDGWSREALSPSTPLAGRAEDLRSDMGMRATPEAPRLLLDVWRFPDPERSTNDFDALGAPQWALLASPLPSSRLPTVLALEWLVEPDEDTEVPDGLGDAAAWRAASNLLAFDPETQAQAARAMERYREALLSLGPRVASYTVGRSSGAYALSGDAYGHTRTVI